MDTSDFHQRLAVQLGYAGVFPFLLLMAGVWFADVSWMDDFVKGQLAYGIVILSFLGGLHWGAAMLRPGLTEADTKKALAWGVTPSLIAWSYFSKKVEMLAVELETLCDEFLRRQYRDNAAPTKSVLSEKK